MTDSDDTDKLDSPTGKRFGKPVSDSAIRAGLKRHGIVLPKEAFPIGDKSLRSAIVQMIMAADRKQQRIDNQSTTIRNQIRTIDEVMQLVDTDPLTGLPNNRAIRRRLSEMLERRHHMGEDKGKRVEEPKFPQTVLVWVDVNDFKTFNDEYSAVAGNLALKHVAQLLRGTYKEGDELEKSKKDVANIRIPSKTKTKKGLLRDADFVGRPHGDEFAIIMHNTTPERAKETMERIKQTIAKKKFHYHQVEEIDEENGRIIRPEGDHELSVSISYGVTPIHAQDTMSELLARVSAEMKRNKPPKEKQEEPRPDLADTAGYLVPGAGFSPRSLLPSFGEKQTGTPEEAREVSGDKGDVLGGNKKSPQPPHASKPLGDDEADKQAEDPVGEHTEREQRRKDAKKKGEEREEGRGGR